MRLNGSESNSINRNQSESTVSNVLCMD